MDWMMYGKVFLVGGLLCVAGQLLLSLTRLTSARILVLFVTLGVVLGALGLYQPLVEFAGAGATVPADRLWQHARAGRHPGGARAGAARGVPGRHPRHGGRRGGGDRVRLSVLAAVPVQDQVTAAAPIDREKKAGIPAKPCYTEGVF